MNRSEPFRVLFASYVGPEPSITAPAFYLENPEASTTIQNKCRNPFDHRTILVHRLIFCVDQP